MEVGNELQELLDVQKELQDVQDQIKVLLDRQEKLYERQSELKSLLEACEDVGSQVRDGASTLGEDWSGTFDWDARADDVKFNIFGIRKYSMNQREIINAIMSQRDVLVIMAAGSGRSLCYLLPAILQEGVALVVSPSLSWIQDQVTGLATLGIPAHMLTSTTDENDKDFIYKALKKGGAKLKILYVTPEKISKGKRFMLKLEKCHHAGRLSLIAIDEAHCCSQSDYDFRPDYKILNILKNWFPSVPMVALTAIATLKIQNDLVEMLQIPKCVKFVSTVNRPNLNYMVREKPAKAEVVVDKIAEFIRDFYPNNESGIVYCFSRKQCERVAKELRDRGISADYYHADMDVNAREKVHLRWSNGKLQVIIGTVAFGMGINKPDVRFVIHQRLSKSMETYYQESGWAGRDGRHSRCLLYYRATDVHRLSSMVFYEKSGLQNLYDVVRYCQSIRQCRHSAFFRHDPEAVQDCNGMCDNCGFSGEIEEVDVSGHAKLVIILLEVVQQKGQTLTVLQLVDKIKTMQKGLGSDLKKKQLQQLVIQLILDEVLKEEYADTANATNVTLGPSTEEVLLGKMKIKIEKRMNDNIKYPKRGLTTSALQFKLYELRKRRSTSRGILLRSVLTRKQISLICDKKPSSIEKLVSIIGERKAGKYGSKILEAVRSTKALISPARIPQ